MIDGSKGFIKEGNKNRLRSQDIHRIVDTFSRQQEVEKYARLVPFGEIEKNDFNLNIPRYIDSSEPEDLQDIEAHLCGGMPASDINGLQSYWQVLPSTRDELFKPANRRGYFELCLEPSEIKSAIYSHPEFEAFANMVTGRFSEWQEDVKSLMMAIQPGGHPKQFIGAISESLLEGFRKIALIDAYDVYQHLMSYWSEMMQDDVYMLVTGGWQEAARVREILAKEDKEKADLVIGKNKYRTELIPPTLVIARYFSDEQQQILNLESNVESLNRQVEELQEEHGGDEGLLNDAKTDKDKLTKGSVKARLSEIKRDSDSNEERQLLELCLDLMDQEASATKALKEGQKQLHAQVLSKYGQLTEDEIKELVVSDKWLATLKDCVQTELDRVSQRLTGRVKELAERYAFPLPALEQQVTECQSRVEEHLKQMGFDWALATSEGRA